MVVPDPLQLGHPGDRPPLAELARTTAAGARIATLICRRRPAGEGCVAVVRFHDQPDGDPVVEVDLASPVVDRLAGRPVATVAVSTEPPFASLQLTGSTTPIRSAHDGLRAYRMSLLSVRFTGPPATAVSVPVTAYHEAAPDPLWRQAPQLLSHLQHAHGRDLLACVRAHGHARVEAVVPRVLDRYGLELALLSDSGVGTLRLPFPGGPVASLGAVTAGLHAVLTCRCGDPEAEHPG